MEVIITNTVGLLIAAILVALIARRLHLPYTVGLVIGGVGLAFAPLHTSAVLTHDFIFDVILPPLLFEAAINIRWKELRRDALPVLTLAIAGTVIAAAIVAAGVAFGLGWPVRAAVLFGVLIAATDPVAVIAMFKDLGVEGRLRLLVESESLFNDGVAAVLFTLAFAWAQSSGGENLQPADIAQTFLVTVGGGVLVGLATAGAALVVAGRTTDPLVWSTLTTVIAYGSFLLAEHFQFSGVLATVIAGILTGNRGFLVEIPDRSQPQPQRDFILELWTFIAFIANSLVFLLIGLTVAGIPFDRAGWAALAFLIALVLFSRALTVYPLCLIFGRSRWAISRSEQHVLWWGGLRGALGLALALSLPQSLPFRNQIVIGTLAVVAFSVVVQGLSMPLLLRVLTFTQKAPDKP